MARVLIIDDEPALRDSLAYAFEREGYDVVAAPDGRQGLDIASRGTADVVILDLMLPDLDGGEVCSQIRKSSRVPIVMLTARDQPSDRLTGFDLGADDYVTKPFNTKELIARVTAVLRREQNAKALLSANESMLDRLTGLAASKQLAVAPPNVASLTFGDITVIGGRSAIRIADRTIPLDAAEYRVMRALCADRGRVVTRTELSQHIWGESSEENRLLLEVVVRTLRQKIEVDAAAPERILTLPGIGYQLVR
ncbi:MAG: response regulator transcription factor [Myxococcales bacterium]